MRVVTEDRYQGEYSDEEEKVLIEMAFHELHEKMRAMCSPEEFEEWQRSVLMDHDADQEPF